MAMGPERSGQVREAYMRLEGDKALMIEQMGPGEECSLDTATGFSNYSISSSLSHNDHLTEEQN